LGKIKWINKCSTYRTYTDATTSPRSLLSYYNLSAVRDSAIVKPWIFFYFDGVVTGSMKLALENKEWFENEDLSTLLFFLAISNTLWRRRVRAWDIRVCTENNKIAVNLKQSWTLPSNLDQDLLKLLINIGSFILTQIYYNNIDIAQTIYMFLRGLFDTYTLHKTHDWIVYFMQVLGLGGQTLLNHSRQNISWK
jgi:hypothetical protein